MKRHKRRLIFRRTPTNQLSLPILLNVLETHEMDGELEIVVTGDLPVLAGGDVVAYSFMTPHIPAVQQEIRRINRPDILIVGGGPHISGDRELAFKIGIDILFPGSGETAFLQFARDLADRDIKKERKIYNSSQEDRNSLDSYFPVSRYMKTLPPLEIMRGCLWRCAYCQTHCNKMEYRDLDSIHRYLKILKETRSKRVNFIAPSALEYGAGRAGGGDVEKIETLLRMAAASGFDFIEYGIFPSEIRPDTVSDRAVGAIKKYVTHKRLTIGAQSGSDERLKQLKRGHSTGDIEQAVEIVNSHGFLANLDFIFGYPDETPEERAHTLDFIRRLHRQYRIRVQSHHFFPLSGSEYAFRLPSPITPGERERLFNLKTSGIGTDQWRENERQVKNFFSWLKRFDAGYFKRYH